MNYIVLNAEPKHQSDSSWENIHQMGMAIGVTYSNYDDQYRFWTDRTKLSKYLHNQTVISFNGLLFESVLLLGNDRIIQKNGNVNSINGDLRWANVDIYITMWRYIYQMDNSDYLAVIEKIKTTKHRKGIFNLASIAKNTLNVNLNNQTLSIQDMYDQKMTSMIFEYALHSIRIIRDIYLFIRKYHYIVTGSYDVVSFK